MRYELSDIADNLPLRRLQEKVIDLLGSVTRVSVETVRIVDAMNEGRCWLLAQNPRLKLGRCLAAYAHLRSGFGSTSTSRCRSRGFRFTSARSFPTSSAIFFSMWSIIMSPYSPSAWPTVSIMAVRSGAFSPVLLALACVMPLWPAMRGLWSAGRHRPLTRLQRDLWKDIA